MIIDTLANLGKYVALNPLFQDVVDYINNNDLASMPTGKVLIKGNELYANFTVAKGKTKAEAKLESHDVMIDIQIPFNVPESMGYTPRTDLDEQPYNAEKDITFYDGLAQQYITVHPGMFVIFFPQDAHAPCVSEASEIRKVIFKVKC
ncbi:MAG: YhcH/YjgK/YiaL family protein [Bacteroidaceae bacterium]|jgi:YhcH/YjgK/YiaL family protein|nr:YhcH/YjgK/YiaL family protein [Bacteroidaceae bacterium]MCR4835923.1 YhcH/YjgK/YiaL family protein [Bacteroidaceae bacterium]